MDQSGSMAFQEYEIGLQENTREYKDETVQASVEEDQRKKTKSGWIIKMSAKIIAEKEPLVLCTPWPKSKISRIRARLLPSFMSYAMNPSLLLASTM
jgi:hypothetical protein